MHHLIKKSAAFVTSAIFAISVQADPATTQKQTLTRTSANALSLQTELQQNAYTQEAYQDTETYYDQIPYEEQEAYTDYERHCDGDNRNFSAHLDLFGVSFRPPGPINPPPAPRPPPPNPPPKPGPTPRPAPPYPPAPTPRPLPGEPPPRPTPHPPLPVPTPHPNPGPRPPGPTPRPAPPYPPAPTPRPTPVPPRPGDEGSNCREVPVTKYRTVIKYRDGDEHTRTVTKYRDVFDHQWKLAVQINFPTGTELKTDESETLQVELKGTEQAPDVVVTPVKAIFAYQVANKQIVNGQAIITLEEVPDLRDSRFVSAGIDGQQWSAQLTLKDTSNADAVTNYTITVLRRNSSGQSVKMGAKNISASDLMLDSKGAAEMPLSDIISSGDLQDYIVSGERINIAIEVRRETRQGAKVRFSKDNWIVVK